MDRKYTPSVYPEKGKIIIKQTKDVKYSGNAADIWHLLAAKPSGHRSQALFETSLRHYTQSSSKLPRFDTLLQKKNEDIVGT